MLRPDTDASPRRRAFMQLRYALHERAWPGSSVLCVLLPNDQTVEVVVNTEHGPLGFFHAEYHHEHGPDEPRMCRLGEACGYDGPSEDDEQSWRDAMT